MSVVVTGVRECEFHLLRNRIMCSKWSQRFSPYQVRVFQVVRAPKRKVFWVFPQDVPHVNRFPPVENDFGIRANSKALRALPGVCLSWPRGQDKNIPARGGDLEGGGAGQIHKLHYAPHVYPGALKGCDGNPPRTVHLS